LHATSGRRAVGNTKRLKAVSLRFVRQLRNNTAQSLVLSIKLGAPFSRRRCGSHPEYAHSVYKNALNKFSFIRLRQRRTSPSRQSCEIVAGVFVPTRADSKDFLRGSNCENKCGQWQSPLCHVSI